MKPILSIHPSKWSGILVFSFITAFYALADSPCETFILKVTFYTYSDRQDSGYIYFNRHLYEPLKFNFIDEYYTLIPRIASNQINYSRIKGCDSTIYDKVLAVNRSVLSDTAFSSGSDVYMKRRIMPFTSRIHHFRYSDTVNYTYYYIVPNETAYSLDSMILTFDEGLSYGKVRFLDPDTIKLIVLDSIIGCGDTNQIQWLQSDQIKTLESEPLITHFKVADSQSQQFWIDFFCFDAEWTKSKILNMLDLKHIDHTLSDDSSEEIFRIFPPSLQRAIESEKVLYFVRWCP